MHTKSYICFIMLFTCTLTLAQESLQESRLRKSKGLMRALKYDQAISALSSLYQKENAEAAYLLGEIYSKVQQYKSDSLSFHYYQKAYDWEYINATYSLSQFYLTGTYVDKDLDKALQLTKEGREKRDIHAATQLGIWYSKGLMNLEQDIAKGIRLLASTGIAGDKTAQRTLFNYFNLKNEPDTFGTYPSSAFHWYKKLNLKNDPNYLRNLAKMFEIGYGNEKNLDSARLLYVRAKFKGSKEADFDMYRIGLVESSNGPDREVIFNELKSRGPKEEARAIFLKGLLKFNKQKYYPALDIWETVDVSLLEEELIMYNTLVADIYYRQQVPKKDPRIQSMLESAVEQYAERYRTLDLAGDLFMRFEFQFSNYRILLAYNNLVRIYQSKNEFEKAKNTFNECI